MTTLDLHQYVQQRLQGVTQQHPLNALGATFQIALLELLTSGVLTDKDEETITASLLGAFAATAPWCVEAFHAVSSPSLAWIRHPKSGKHILAEPGTGADFALIIRVSANQFRVAIFQAKKSKSGFFSVDHISPARAAPKKHPEPQFLRLADHGLAVLKAVGKRLPSFKQLGWVHYLVYEDLAFTCSALTVYQPIYAFYKNAKQIVRASVISSLHSGIKKKEITALFEKEWKLHLHADVLKANNAIDFSALLTAGATKFATPKRGFLELNSITKVQAFLNCAIDFMDVYECSDDPSLTPIPLSKNTQKRITRLNHQKALLNRSLSRIDFKIDPPPAPQLTTRVPGMKKRKIT
ncbi:MULTISPECIES: hypothetical protein [Xanthomonas]|uniref:Uncharacterized protein n=1 Tax=Xanthomonas arboricola pv. populi TaxID=487823 RepID=A0A2S6YZH6_9XANT|nr:MULTISPECIES: hypothetical protein [Xanthomonas]MEB1941252.1 hypothetical protein [Xanthomonas campestris pv. campestris]PPT73599.1 hypothetical protein XaplCFBP3122_19805 [Xanthomonas arboricola pv. populi]UYP76627.1 hypothetical protein OF401_13890 [Xanthomonas campestris pv. campestris]